MIVVRVELWPGGIKERASLLGVMVISNDGTGSETVGNYDVGVAKGDRRGAFRTGRVEGHRRKDLSVWRLVARAIAVCFPPVKAKSDRRQREMGI